MKKYEIVATTLTGLESVLANEIVNLGGEKVTELKRAVRFFGDDALLYKSNLALRTALRILVPLDEFRADNEDNLYRLVFDFPWEQVFDVNQTFAIDAVVSGFTFKHSKYVALKTKDAIVDRFRDVYGKRPSVDPENPEIRLNVHVNNNQVAISIDSSGLSLDRRGYRLLANEAPINEVLAAGIVLLSGWRSDKAFVDPMSGSGTFGIEAALIGTNTPPNLTRSFSFQNWLEYDEELFNQVVNELKDGIIDSDLMIYSRDILTKNIDIISQNVVKAGVEDYLSVKKEDFFLSEPKKESGVVVLNPPYGERLKMEDNEAFYKRIGDTLKQKYTNYDVWIISSDFNAMRAIGLKSTFRTELMNGGLKAWLSKFEIYKGRKEE